MKKTVIYLRVSSKEQKEEGYSIPAQKKLLTEYARVNDFKIVKEFEDDETAKSEGRTGFGLMVEFLRNNKDVNTVLVEKTDRLYRNFKDYVTIDELDVTVILVKENERIGKDASSHQKFIHGIKLLMAKNYIDNLSEEVKKGLTQKAESGAFPCNTLPFGYAKQIVDGKSFPVVDEVNSLFVVKMFQYYTTGLYSIVTLLEKMREEGLLGLTKSSAHKVLRNPFYYGDFLWKEKLYHGTHEPLISKELWDKVQQMMDRFKNKEMLSKYKTQQFTFRGFLKCAECGRTITAERKIKPSGREYVYYRCTKYGFNCSQPPVSEEVLDEQMEKSLEGLKLSQEAIDGITHGLKEMHAAKVNTEDKIKVRLETQKKDLEQRLNTLYEDRLEGVITKEFYQKKFSEYEVSIQDLGDRIAKYEEADIDYYKVGTTVLELANKASFLYKQANMEERRELLSFLLSNSILKRKKLLIQYKKPFDRVFVHAASFEWRGLLDDFRTMDWQDFALNPLTIINQGRILALS